MEKTVLPPQHQARQPGIESEMVPPPQSAMASYVGSGKLRGQVALITGGDSGIGRAVAIAFAKEGADVAIVYLSEEGDAAETRCLVEVAGQRCLLIKGDISDEAFCRDAVRATTAGLGRLDILINNAAEQHPQDSIEAISAAQLERTFRTNIFAMFYLVKAALPYLRNGGRIVNTSSVTAYRGSPKLLDYSASKGAIVAFTRSLSVSLRDEGIRVNAVAPGPVWTPLIPASFDADEVAKFGSKAPMGRAGQPDEIAPSFVFLVSPDSSYISGQVLHPNGGEIING
ncbi:SDR family oxidoreductase [Chitinimonas arctica]|uniref:SDR family oxidoreductase n=1 Tax=Chitinimonas arctica TaxID=2594795 RepID=A0A516SDP5_9NEIS|nr:SDR family oxidoreductase [Chitinimonas arctica]QDQ26158.1 SDR family oxidoreductase [Chitinimonas arctica]